jgi:hypothetical protein
MGSVRQPRQLRVAQVHAQQVGGEQRRLGPAGAGADLQEAVALVVGVRRDQQAMQLGLEGVAAGGALSRSSAPARPSLRSAGRASPRRPRRGLVEASVAIEAAHQGLELGVLAAQIAEAVLVGLGLGLGEQGGDLAEALRDALQPAADRWIHRGLLEAVADRP